MDLNIENRGWENVEPEFQYFILRNRDKDTFWCSRFNMSQFAAIDPDGDQILVAKPYELRGTFWAGKSIAGIGYTVNGGSGEGDSHNSRIASDGNTSNDETQDVTPVWQTGTGDNDTVILARFMPEGTGAFRNGEQAMWQDVNDGGRAFAQRFA
jgi:hypothetical protein